MNTKTLLSAGVIAGPLFVITVVAQMFTRAGFDPKRHPLSLLSLGELGWIQITNFVLCGLLAFVSAFGLRRVLADGRGSKWGPILIGAYGLALVWGGVFVADPIDGYPVGTPLGTDNVQLSWHGILHALAPVVAGIALIAAAVIFARRFAAEAKRGWMWYTIITLVLYLVLATASFPLGDFRIQLAGGAALWIWVSLITAHYTPRP
ncbi:DUF998 domain-containing protein [Allorhizocola rhizosphaerae]|uniref:DUF998 domain-containing protein n=1 Tax=Allorhizocola rhizosphaerae TaxID=1872709 RepID=UPI000E3D6DC0|nr:DUF998 domain-containing protein [Allorhizocola rhizosphaerae]